MHTFQRRGSLASIYLNTSDDRSHCLIGQPNLSLQKFLLKSSLYQATSFCTKLSLPPVGLSSTSEFHKIGLTMPLLSNSPPVFENKLPFPFKSFFSGQAFTDLVSRFLTILLVLSFSFGGLAQSKNPRWELSNKYSDALDSVSAA